MPAPDPDFIVGPPVASIRVALEPAHNALHSLLLLNVTDELSGLDEWVMHTAAAMTLEQRHKNRLVLNGFYYATVPDQSWSGFPTYVDHLAALDPAILRDRIFSAYVQAREDKIEGRRYRRIPDPVQDRSLDLAPVMKDVETYLDFLKEGFSVEKLDLEIEREAYGYLNDPPAMQSLIVSHFRAMWDTYLAEEWARVMPMLQASVDAFHQFDFRGLSKLEAVQRVLQKEIDEEMAPMLEEMERIIFSPSKHAGPYAGKFRAGDTLWVLFGAHIPQGVQVNAPDLSRAEILVRLSALADDTRLRILRLISEEGELRSQDIMTRLDLSQSAASRHLKQLSATGYLCERRCEGSKCYTLNPKRVEDTLHAISVFLLGKQH